MNKLLNILYTKVILRTTNYTYIQDKVDWCGWEVFGKDKTE